MSPHDPPRAEVMLFMFNVFFPMYPMEAMLQAMARLGSFPVPVAVLNGAFSKGSQGVISSSMTPRGICSNGLRLDPNFSGFGPLGSGLRA